MNSVENGVVVYRKTSIDNLSSLFMQQPYDLSEHELRIDQSSYEHHL